MTTATTHPFRPDVVGEPGYRARCLTCGLERHPIPHPRDPGRPADQQQRNERQKA
jgi:hypothetical protein